MGVNYDVPAGKVFTIAGPAQVVVKGSFEEPLIVDSVEEIEAAAPTIASIEPSEAAIGDPNFDLVVTGENFTAQSVIVFAGYDEPTTLNEDGTLSTGVNMAVWQGADTVEVSVRNGPAYSSPVEFTFTEPASREGETREKRPHARTPKKRSKSGKSKR